MTADLPKEFARRLAEVLDNNAERLEFARSCRAMAEDPVIVLRPHRLRPVDTALVERWKLRDLPWSPGSFFAKPSFRPELRHHPLVASGSFYWQEGAAVEAAEVLSPSPNDRVLDLCAAPGSKATHLAEFLAGGSGWLVANEVDRSRAEKLRQILARHGTLWTSVTSMPVDGLIAHFREASFDKILLDAPCSGESLFAKRRDYRKDVYDREVRQAAVLQRSLLERASRLLAAGGRLLYSTCTYSRIENEEIIEGFLKEAGGEYSLIREGRRWPHRDGVPGGYWALLERPGSRKTPARLELNNWRGVLASGGYLWNGEADLFHWGMQVGEAGLVDRLKATSPLPIQVSEEISFRPFDLTEDQARRYWTGEALRHDDFVGGENFRLFFNNSPVGSGRGVEGRLNTFLPKALRLQGA